MGTCKDFSMQTLWASAIAEARISWKREWKTSPQLSDKKFFELVNPGTLLDCRAEFDAFLSEYSVQRTLPSTFREGFLVAILEQVDHQAGFLNRACAIRHQNKSSLRGAPGAPERFPLSAASKLSWFLAPDNWTLYDSFVRRALSAASFKFRSSAPKDPFLRHYFLLTSLNAEELFLRVDVLLKAFSEEYHGLFASRVVDKLLWTMGSHDYFKRVTNDTLGSEADQRIAADVCADPSSMRLNKWIAERWGVPM